MSEVTPTYFYSAQLIIDAATGQVRTHSGEEARLSPVNMRVALFLAENVGRVVSRNELFEHIWKQQEVGDDTLTRAISDIRAALSTLSSEKFIETIPKKGYRWLPQVSAEPGYSAPTSSANKSAYFWLLAGITASLLMLSAFALWMGTSTSTQRFAVLPPKIIGDQSIDAHTAYQYQEVLRQYLLKVEGAELLSTHAIELHSKSIYPTLAREFDTQWVIETSLIKDGEAISVVSSVVNAENAYVKAREIQRYKNAEALSLSHARLSWLDEAISNGN
jgi:DNA-binding winged helix-turn-helix (wHTH) protein